MTAPQTPAARRMRIADLISQREISSQEQLREVLAAEGINVTQATLSRDLVDIGAVRIRDGAGHARYMLTAQDELHEAEGANQRLGRTLADLLVQVECSGNIVVIRTPPGAAQYLASALDRAGWAAIMGTVAGDDTVFIVTRDVDGGASLSKQLITYAEKGRMP